MCWEHFCHCQSAHPVKFSFHIQIPWLRFFLPHLLLPLQVSKTSPLFWKDIHMTCAIEQERKSARTALSKLNFMVGHREKHSVGKVMRAIENSKSTHQGKEQNAVQWHGAHMCSSKTGEVFGTCRGSSGCGRETSAVAFDRGWKEMMLCRLSPCSTGASGGKAPFQRLSSSISTTVCCLSATKLGRKCYVNLLSSSSRFCLINSEPVNPEHTLRSTMCPCNLDSYNSVWYIVGA